MGFLIDVKIFMLFALVFSWMLRDMCYMHCLFADVLNVMLYAWFCLIDVELSVIHACVFDGCCHLHIICIVFLIDVMIFW